VTILETLSLVREGRIYELARARFRGMPNHPSHPRFDIVTYRTPRGLRLSGEEPWATGNELESGYVSELIMASTHTGAHIDALSHVTVDDRWASGEVDRDLGDFGPLTGDATELGPMWARGVLLDVPRHRGVETLPAGSPVPAHELEAIEQAQGVRVEAGDVVLIRTGCMARWPDAEWLATHYGAGPDESGGRWLADRRVSATGSDTEGFEVTPPVASEAPSSPLPVHVHLLVERRIPILENLDLEELAQDRVYKFLFVGLPLKIRGATGSMLDPIAVI